MATTAGLRGWRSQASFPRAPALLIYIAGRSRPALRVGPQARSSRSGPLRSQRRLLRSPGSHFSIDRNSARVARIRVALDDALGARKHLHGAVELWVAACRVARVERDFDRRRDADPFQALTVDQHVLDREQEQAVVADQERGRRQHRPFGAMADELAEPIFLESIGKHFLAATGAFI